MPHGFDCYRVFISAPGDLSPDRNACHEAISRVNDEIAMPAKVLLVSIGLRENDQIEGHRGIVSDNVRWSAFFIQLFQDDWGPRDLFRKLLFLATECRADAAMPLRDIVVFLKDAPHETNAEILAFRRELDELGGVRVMRYANAAELVPLVENVAAAWAKDLIAGGAGVTESTTETPG